MGGASCCPIPWPSGPRVSRETTHNDTAEDEDDLQLLKLGYRAELARAWVAFDNVTFSFAALHCIGGIRVFFYIVLSAGGPAAMIWLPIGVSKTYGFRPAEYGFTSTYNGGGMAPGLNWILSWYLPARCLVGQHASGHIAEETVTARKSAANGVFWSTVASSLCGLHYHPLPVLHAHDRNIPRRSVPQPFININILAGLSGGREYESNHQSFIQIIVVTLAIPIVGLHG
ncbi:hypothetical protein KXX02_005044 [Aspergillus fumigatus]|nr:hypothetical protein KXX02_005044 [Aspergillus fumigatus]